MRIEKTTCYAWLMAMGCIIQIVLVNRPGTQAYVESIWQAFVTMY